MIKLRRWRNRAWLGGPCRFRLAIGGFLVLTMLTFGVEVSPARAQAKKPAGGHAAPAGGHAASGGASGAPAGGSAHASPAGGAGHGASGAGGRRGGAQQGGGYYGGGQPGRGPGMTPPGYGPGGMGGRQKTAKKAKPDDDELTLPEVDPNLLPTGYVPPKTALEQFTTDKEWIFSEWAFENIKDKDPVKEKALREKEVKRKINAFQNLRQKSSIGEDDRKLIVEFVRWSLAQITLKENRDSAHLLREKLVKELRRVGSKNTPPQIHKVMIDAIVKESPKLFEYHFVARFNAALLLTDLNDIEAEMNDGTAISCVSASEPLFALLKDTSQLEPLRWTAVKGLVRIHDVPDLKTGIKHEIVHALVDQMNHCEGAHFWYQFRLAEALGQLKTVDDEAKKPIVVTALARIVVDTTRNYLVRTTAAQSIGRLPLEGKINTSLLAFEMARLGAQMSEEYEKHPGRPEWTTCFLKLHNAFHILSADDKKRMVGLLTQVQAKPGLAAHKKAVQDSYELLSPLIQEVLRNAQHGLPNGPKLLAAEPMKKLRDWLKSPPKDQSVAPGEPQLVKQAAAETKPETVGVGPG